MEGSELRPTNRCRRRSNRDQPATAPNAAPQRKKKHNEENRICHGDCQRLGRGHPRPRRPRSSHLWRRCAARLGVGEPHPKRHRPSCVARSDRPAGERPASRHERARKPERAAKPLTHITEEGHPEGAPSSAPDHISELYRGIPRNPHYYRAEGTHSLHGATPTTNPAAHCRSAALANRA